MEAQVQSRKDTITLLEPRGNIIANFRPLNPRVADLNNKVIYLADMGKPRTDFLLEHIADYLKERFPQVKTVYLLKYKAYKIEEEAFSPLLYGQKDGKADGVIMAVGD